MPTPLQEAREDENMKILEYGGHHNPRRTYGRGRGCGCKEETPGGHAYRDVKIRLENGVEKRYYHQNRVVTYNPESNRYDINTHGFGGHPTTRNRINRDLPRGFWLVQRDHVTLLSCPNGGLVEVPRRFVIELGAPWARVKTFHGECVADVWRGSD